MATVLQPEERNILAKLRLEAPPTRGNNKELTLIEVVELSAANDNTLRIPKGCAAVFFAEPMSTFSATDTLCTFFDYAESGMQYTVMGNLHVFTKRIGRRPPNGLSIATGRQKGM